MLKLEIVTPEKKVFDDNVDSVTVPTASGEAGIMPQHAPLISAIKPGILAYTLKGTTDRLAVSDGFIEVNNNKVSILVDSAESASEIDIDSAKRRLDELERSGSNAAVSSDEAQASKSLIDHAQAQVQIASNK